MIWETNFEQIVYEMLLLDDFLFLSNFKQLWVLDNRNGQQIETVKRSVNLSNAIQLHDFLTWNTFENNQNVLIFFNTKTFAIEKELILDDIASFLLSDGKSIIVNQYRHLIKAISPNDLNVIWQQEVMEKTGSNFINEYPFIQGAALFVSQFPDTLKKVSLLNGEILWKFSAKTGVNSFPSNYSRNNTIGFLSGSIFFVLDLDSGEILSQYDLGAVKLLKSDIFQVSFFTAIRLVLFAYRSGQVIELDLTSLELKSSFALKKRLKIAPFIAAEKVFVLDVEGNLWY